MPSERSTALLRTIRRLVRPDLKEWTDAQLVDHFVQTRSEIAFAALMRRHGALVLSVGHRYVGNLHDAEDVYQATFLLLARKAGRVKGTALGSWLYGVAYRLAMKARTSAARRRQHERRAAEMAKPHSESGISELQIILDEEVQHLAEKYRAPFVLCCLENKSRLEAARELGLKEGTLATRIDRARKILQKRLARRGITLSAALTASSVGSTVAAVPSKLAEETLQAALAYLSGGTANISAGALALAQGAMVGKAKLAFVLLTAAALAIGGVGWAAYRASGAQIPKERPEATSEAQAKEPEKKNIAVTSGSNGQVRMDAYGDPLPEGAVARFGTSRLRHGQYVRSVAFSPDGKEVASSSYDGTIRFWDAKTGAEIRRFPKSFETPGRIAYTAGGRELIVAEETWWGAFERRDFRGVRVWDATTGKLLRELGKIDSPMDARRVSVSSDGRRVAFPNGRTVSVVDPSQSAQLALQNGSLSIEVDGAREITHVALSADGRRLAVGALLNVEGQVDRERQPSFVRVYDLETGKTLWSKEGFTGNAWGNFPAAEFSPDGKSTALSFTYTMQMELADADTGKWLRHFKSRTIGFWPFHFAADGSKLYVSGWRGPNEIWDVNTGETSGAWSRDEGLFDLALSPDGKTLASALNRSIRLAAADTGKPTTPENGMAEQVNHIQLHPDGQRLFGASQRNGNGFTLWDRLTGRRLYDYPTDNPANSLSPDGNYVAMGWPLALFDLSARKVLRETPKKGVALRWLTYSPDGQRIFGLGWAEQTVFELDPGTMVPRPFIVGVKAVALAVFPDGNRMAVGVVNEKKENQRSSVDVEIWELGEKLKVRSSLTGLSGSYTATVAVSSDGRRVAAGSADDRFYHTGENPDTRVLVWDADSGVQVAALPGSINGHRCVTFSPDGRTVAAGGEDHCTYIWELASGKVRAKLKGHEGPVTSLAFATDNRTLYTGSSDTTILCWDLESPPTTPMESADMLAHLRDPDAMKAHVVMRNLVSAHDRTVAELTRRVKKAATPTEADLKKLIADLDSPMFSARETASKELVRIGRASLPLVRDAAKTGSLELKLRANRLIPTLESVYPLSGERLFQVRAVEILERIASPDARRLLLDLADGAREDNLTEEARASLERLRQRDTASK